MIQPWTMIFRSSHRGKKSSKKFKPFQKIAFCVSVQSSWLAFCLSSGSKINEGICIFSQVWVVIGPVTFHSLHSLLSHDRMNNISNHLLWLEIHKSNFDQQTLWVTISNFIAIEWYCTETFLIMVPVDVINILHSGWGGVKFIPCTWNVSYCLQDLRCSLRVV